MVAFYLRSDKRNWIILSSLGVNNGLGKVKMNSDDELMFSGWRAIVYMLIAVMALAAFLSGCPGGPSRQRYKELLRECRESNRECQYRMKPCVEEIDSQGMYLLCPQSVGARNLGQ